MEALASVVRRMFVKYWIYVCGTMFFFVSFEGKIVLYKVIYMVMFLCCVALYQVIFQVLRVLLLCVMLLCTATLSCYFHCSHPLPGNTRTTTVLLLLYVLLLHSLSPSCKSAGSTVNVLLALGTWGLDLELMNCDWMVIESYHPILRQSCVSGRVSARLDP